MASIIWTATNQAQSPISPEQASDAQYVERYIMGPKRIANTFSTAPWNQILNIVSRSTESSPALKPEWMHGDIYPVTTTLSAACVIPASATAGTAVTVELTAGAGVQPDKMILLRGTGSSVSTVDEVVIRYRPGAGQSIVVSNKNSSGFTVAAASTVYFMGEAMLITGESPNGSFIGNYFLYNYMQRFRTSVQIGPASLSNANYCNVDQGEQMRIKTLSIEREKEMALMSNVAPVGHTSNGFSDSCAMGGLDYFVRPYTTTGMPDINGNALSDVRGRTYLRSGTTPSFRNLQTMMDEITTFGNSDYRFLIGTPDYIQSYMDMARAEGALTMDSEFTFPQFPDMRLKSPSIRTGLGDVFLIRNKTATDITKYATNGTNYTSSTRWGYILDPEQFKKIYHVRPGDDPNPGVQTFRWKTVQLGENNTEVKKTECDETFTVRCLEPRANGFEIFGTLS